MRVFFGFFCTLSLTFPCLGAPEKVKGSSSIPAKREFPVDEKVKPCDDFYSYTCDKVRASFKLRDDRSSHTFSFGDSSERLLESKRKWLQELVKAKATSESSRARELRDVFTACMKVSSGKKEERALVKALVATVATLKTPQEFRAFIGEKVLSEDFGVFETGTIPNQDDPTFSDAYILGSLSSLPERTYYDKPEVIKGLELWITEFFKTIGKSQPAERAKAVVAFEKAFAQTFPLPAAFRDLMSTKTGITRQELAERYPNLPLQTFLTHVPAETRLRHWTPDNFAWLDKAFVDTPLEIWKDVYLWHALPEYMDDAYPAFFKTGFEFQRTHLGGPDKRPVRAERCTKLVMHDFSKEIDAELVDTIFPMFPTERFIKLAENVRESIVAGVEANAWLTPEARTKAAEKMRTAKLQLVKPLNEAEWDFNLPADYADDKPNANRRLWKLKSHEKEFGKLGKPRNRDEWGMGPLTVNAYYSPSDNKFVMPIGILQYPFFDPNASDEVNLGAVGAVIGHELGHGIDDKGARYDAQGRLAKWMNEADLGEFKRRGTRLVEQFGKAGHNGELTLGENIGDLVGLTFAYRAAFPIGGAGSPEAKRAFFLQYGRAWCQVMRPKYREVLLKTDPHAMGDARVNEQVKHQGGFVEAFGCKEGDRLYLKAEDRVIIW